VKKIYISIILGLIMLAAVGCSAAQDDVIGIRGEVTSISTGNAAVVLLVEGEVEEDTVYDKASVRIQPETKVVRQEDGKDIAASSGDIKLYDKVEVVFEGAVAESYPVQGTAKLIRILE